MSGKKIDKVLPPDPFRSGNAVMYCVDSIISESHFEQAKGPVIEYYGSGEPRQKKKIKDSMLPYLFQKHVFTEKSLRSCRIFGTH
jgi:hypothetical protein